MRRLITVFVVTTALVVTLASSALAYIAQPCIIGCFGTDSTSDVSLR